MTVSSLQDPVVWRKADALLSSMNLDQKIGQMTLAERSFVSPQEVRDHHIGAVLSGAGSSPGNNLPEDWVAMNDAYWSASMEADHQHLAIPVMYGTDAVHGHNNLNGATIFPHNIGLGAAGDPGLVGRIAAITAREVLATGIDWVFAPSLSVAGDCRWGRTYESFSVDTSTVAAYAAEFVKGIQSQQDGESLAACAKHWVGDGGTKHGIDQGEVTLDFAELERKHIAAYLPAIHAGVLTIMASFNSWNGDKCHGHRFLLTDVLKNRLQFNGLVVSDWDGINYLSEDYHVAIALAVNAGIDMFMVPQSWREFIRHLIRHVERGSVPMRRIDDAVRRILAVKFATGLFNKPRPRERTWTNHSGFGSLEHRKVAREAVRKSLVLLKNEQDLLPLDRNSRVFVAGKNANNLGHQCGGFSVNWQGFCGNDSMDQGTSIWRAIREATPNAVLSDDPHGGDADPEKHDVAIIVVGEEPYAEGQGDIRSCNRVIVEAGSQIRGGFNILKPYGNTLELAKLHPEDLQTIRTVSAKGIPVVVILISGRPMVVNQELQASAAFVAAWLPGSEGQGVSDVLFGDFDFEGKLSFEWPESEQHPSHGNDHPTPLFHPGYGLRYTPQNDRS